MPFAGVHGPADIEQKLAAEQQALNSSRYIPEEPEIYQKISEQNRLYIYNVGPWMHKRELGSCGVQVIRACPEDQDYSEPLVVNGVEQEPYPMNEVAMVMIPKAGKPGQLTGAANGKAFAEQIIGEGPFIPKSASFVPFGVFISPVRFTPEGKPHVRFADLSKPSQALITKARAALNQKYTELVREANDAYSRGPSAANEMIQPDWHFIAARKLMKSEAECPWLRDSQAPAERDNCPSCGKVYVMGIMKCGCGYILDKPRYDKAKQEGMFAD
jgi:hypothetical protein